jgi:hypothetical protein
MANSTPSIDQLKRAIALSEQIENLQTELAALFGGSSKVTAVAPTPAAPAAPMARGRKKGGMSAEGRARIIAAQKARWAKIKAAKGTPAVTTAPVAKKKKGGMSAEGRARIIAAQKARWAKVKATAKPSSSPAKAAAPKKKGGISPEGLARIKAAQKARWAKFKKAKA